jgi:hypothetical protein
VDYHEKTVINVEDAVSFSTGSTLASFPGAMALGDVNYSITPSYLMKIM